MEDAAEVVDRCGGEGLVFAELLDGGAGNAVVFDQGIGGFGGLLQLLPKGLIADHRIPPKRINFILGCICYLDYSR